ncbi:unnamed protein product [Rotaria sordida]|uniref:Uncharacterized protein n=1 Tax=Rotaria sordida TaxID=392033 RepID=A0A816B943_9BILA|nr:unnamed protein product [Rotaria sordida]CAF1431229.1 unnamed protein product [Rotaria sordida]CAF1605939.1 unnamed protein product [Rotaria sordida]CAF4218057.1 unnamed protein product [Rotaria sordida]
MIKRDSITISCGSCKDDNGSEFIDYIVEKHDASRNVWQRSEYNDLCTFTYTNIGFTEDVTHHFHIRISIFILSPSLFLNVKYSFEQISFS